MNLCIPFNTIEPLAGKLSSDAWSAYSKRVTDPRQKLNLETSISQAQVEMVVQLAETKLTTAEFRSLAVGDVIMTEQPTEAGMLILIEGRPMFLGHPGSYKGHKAIQIHQAITRPKDLVERRLAEQVESSSSSSDDPSGVHNHAAEPVS